MNEEERLAALLKQDGLPADFYSDPQSHARTIEKRFYSGQGPSSAWLQYYAKKADVALSDPSRSLENFTEAAPPIYKLRRSNLFPSWKSPLLGIVLGILAALAGLITQVKTGGPVSDPEFIPLWGLALIPLLVGVVWVGVMLRDMLAEAGTGAAAMEPRPQIGKPVSDSGKAAAYEVTAMARRTAGRLRFGYWLHVSLAIATYAILASLIGAAAYMVYDGIVEEGALFGAGGVIGIVLSSLIWKPFTASQKALYHTQQFEALLLSLRLRLIALADQEMHGSKSLEKDYWRVVRQYTKDLQERYTAIENSK